jgi:hypothetical protein
MKLSRAGAIGLCFMTFVALASCSNEVETHEAYSPDRKLVLRIEVDWSGGAAVSDQTSAYVFASASPMKGRTLVFRGSAMSAFSASWRGPSQIGVAYDEGDVSKCDPSPVLSTGERISVSGCK